MMDGDAWKLVTGATSIGARRIIRLPAPVSSNKVRLLVTQSAAPPMVSEFSLFRQAPL
jgi:alpha-L-fucosidase